MEKRTMKTHTNGNGDNYRKVNPPPTLTVMEVAEILRVQKATIYKWIREDGFPHVRLGKRILVPTASLAKKLDMTSHDLVASLELEWW